MIEIENTDTKQTGDISLRELILKFGNWYRYLVSKRLIIIGISLVGALIGFGYAKFKSVEYVATTTFVLEESEKGGGLGQYAGLASMAGIDLGGGGGGVFEGDNILELYKSRAMIEKSLLTSVVINDKKLLLIDRYIEFNHLKEEWKNRKDLQQMKFSPDGHGINRLQDSLMGKIVNDIRVNYLVIDKADKKSNIIKAVVKCKDEAFAKAFNEQIVNTVSTFYVQTKTKKSLNNINILEQKADSVRSVMNGAIYSAAAASDATPNLNITRSTQRTIPIQKSQFSIETSKLILSEIVKNLELAKISLRKETPLIQVIDVPVYPLEIKKVSNVLGAIIGFTLFAFIVIIVLCCRMTIKSIMATE